LGGFATIAIDMVLHGERSIDADGDGQIDPSGASFINLANILLSRDNIRQSVSDLMVLTRMISSGAADLSGDGAPDLIPSAITFAGLSMGGIVGTTFVTAEPNVQLADINVAGGRLGSLLRNSATFGPAIDAGLAQFGLLPGTPLYDIYFYFAQAIVDDADPINYATQMASGNLAGGVPTVALLQEMIGDGVVPNSATRDLALAMGVPQLDAVEEVAGLEQLTTPHLGSGMYQFTSPADPGTRHGALLSPAGGNPTALIQVQALTFLGTGLLGSPTIIDPLTALKQSNQEMFWFGADYEVDATQMNFFPR
jgi:hypothetical protein